MNKRITQFYEQCNQVVDDPFGGAHISFDHQMFAELIVQECMQMCDNVSADYLKHRKAADDFQDKNIYAEGEAACDIIKYQMKKHFGVEE
jgi:hypothetical protein